MSRDWKVNVPILSGLSSNLLPSPSGRGAGGEGNLTPERIQAAYRLALQRDASAEEVGILTKLYQTHRMHYDANPKEAQAILGVGYAPAATEIAPAELAAWTSVARAILNLHETITRN